MECMLGYCVVRIKLIFIKLLIMVEFFWLIKGNGIFVKGNSLIVMLMFLNIWKVSIMVILVEI